MGPRQRTRREIIELLARAAEQAEHAEAYHAAAADPGAVKGRAAQQAARYAAAMQLIELAGCAEGFTRNRGDPGTTLARFDDALRPVIELRNAHTHPETGSAVPPITPSGLRGIIADLKKALGNLDPETRKIEAWDQKQALNRLHFGLGRIERDGLPNAATLRARDLDYAGYYHEIQFARLAKATGLFNSWNSPDVRRADVNSSIFDADDFAHQFHAMRGNADKSNLPVSVVAAEHDKRVPGRLLSEIIRELRNEYQRPTERLAELEASLRARDRERYLDAVRGLAQKYAQMTGDREAATLIYEYVQAQKPPLQHEIIEGMTKALQAAAGPGSSYPDIPKAVYNRCLELCIALDERGDSRLLEILDAADARSKTAAPEKVYDIYPGLTRHDGNEPELGMDPDLGDERGPKKRR